MFDVQLGVGAAADAGVAAAIPIAANGAARSNRSFFMFSPFPRPGLVADENRNDCREVPRPAQRIDGVARNRQRDAPVGEMVRAEDPYQRLSPEARCAD